MVDLKLSGIRPRIIIHGGAGNITRKTFSRDSYDVYHNALLTILRDAYERLKLPQATALDVAVHAVCLLENHPLFNAGRGAVFTTHGTHELEASVMVSRGYRKRGVGVMKVSKAKNPIKLAREMLIRGEEDNGGGAQGHSQLHGQTCDDLVERWGLETTRPSHFWTRQSWDQHRRGLGLSYSKEEYFKAKREADERAGFALQESVSEESTTEKVGEMNFDNPDGYNTKDTFVPQGTVGCVVLDSVGTIAVATSTGGITNKLPGRIGDTPTLGAGFWAEEWIHTNPVPSRNEFLPRGLTTMVDECLPSLSGYLRLQFNDIKQSHNVRAVAMSGTGNGDSFLRVNAVRTAAAMARFSSPNDSKSTSRSNQMSLQEAVSAVAGPDGFLQQSAEDRWGSGEGEGGMIGIELDNGHGKVVFDYNCGGMFHAWINEEGQERFAVFQDEK